MLNRYAIRAAVTLALRCASLLPHERPGFIDVLCSLVRSVQLSAPVNSRRLWILDSRVATDECIAFFCIAVARQAPSAANVSLAALIAVGAAVANIPLSAWLAVGAIVTPLPGSCPLRGCWHVPYHAGSCLHISSSAALQVAPVRSAGQPQRMVGTWQDAGAAQEAQAILRGEVL
jgi:hypothetical protein